MRRRTKVHIEKSEFVLHTFEWKSVNNICLQMDYLNSFRRFDSLWGVQIYLLRLLENWFVWEEREREKRLPDKNFLHNFIVIFMKASLRSTKRKQKKNQTINHGSIQAKRSLGMIIRSVWHWMALCWKYRSIKMGFAPFINEITHKCHLFRIYKNTNEHIMTIKC